MLRTWVNVAAAEWSDCGGGRGNAGIRSSNLGKNMTKTPKPETESDLEREYHRNRSRKRKNSKQLNLSYGNLIIMNLKNSTQRIELGKNRTRSQWCQHVWRVHMRDSANKLLGSARLSGSPFPIFINQLRLKTRHCTPPTIVLYCD